MKPSEPTERDRGEPSVETFRRKLDAAIIAEAWEAVKAIRERILELEQEQASNVVTFPARGRRD